MKPLRQANACWGMAVASPSPRPSPPGRGGTVSSHGTKCERLFLSGSGLRFSLSHRERAGVRGRLFAISPHVPSFLRARGFTLLELLIAISVFAMVLLAINGVFYGAMRLRSKTSRMIEQSLPVQQTVAIIKRDL